MTFEPVAMGSGEDWLMRPVLEGMCRYESLTNGTLGLVDVARMNDALDCQNENQRRMALALEKKR